MIRIFYNDKQVEKFEKENCCRGIGGYSYRVECEEYPCLIDTELGINERRDDNFAVYVFKAIALSSLVENEEFRAFYAEKLEAIKQEVWKSRIPKMCSQPGCSGDLNHNDQCEKCGAYGG